jgi:colanic acid/amylovoran biosynthesis glycosyltransferase
MIKERKDENTSHGGKQATSEVPGCSAMDTTRLRWSFPYSDVRTTVQTAWEWHRRYSHGFAPPTPPLRTEGPLPLMIIAYLTPIYPSPSLTFIRREIAALESQGFTVHRFTLRRFANVLVDEVDRTEQKRTRAILEAGAFGLGMALVLEALGRPRCWWAAFIATLQIGIRSERGLIRHLIYFAEACVFRRLLAACGAEHVHAHFGSNSAAIAWLCQLLGGPPYSITIHGPEEFDAPRSLSIGKKVHHAAFVVAVSEFTRSQLYRWSALEDWPRIHVIHCGLDRNLLETAAVPVPDRPRLVNVGRLSEQKGQLLLIEAVARLRKRGFDLELIIVGDGTMRSEIERHIDRFGLQSQVRITGYLSNQRVCEELLAARALVLPSFAEGLPVVIMEALALGRPVVCTQIAGIAELVEPGVNGWLVPAGAIEPLVEAMAEVLTAEPAELDQMGRAGMARVGAQHDALTEARKLASLILDPGTVGNRDTTPSGAIAAH